MKNVKIFGDSILQGVYYDGRYHKSKDKINIENVSIDNYSRMGSTIEHGIKNIEKHIDEFDENTVVVIEYGGNDCNYNWSDVSMAPDEEHLCAVEPDEYMSKLKKAINLIKEKKCKVIVAIPIPISAKKFMDFISKNLSYDNILKWLGDVDHLFRWQEYYSQLTEKVAKACGCAVMPLRNVFQTEDYEDMLCSDGIHPTQEGHERIHRYIEEYLARTC